jgi:hypothetical protein
MWNKDPERRTMGLECDFAGKILAGVIGSKLQNGADVQAELRKALEVISIRVQPCPNIDGWPRSRILVGSFRPLIFECQSKPARRCTRDSNSGVHGHFPSRDLAVTVVDVALDPKLCVAVAAPDTVAESDAEPLFEEALAIHYLRDVARKRST